MEDVHKKKRNRRRRWEGRKKSGRREREREENHCSLIDQMQPFSTGAFYFCCWLHWVSSISLFKCSSFFYNMTKMLKLGLLFFFTCSCFLRLQVANTMLNKTTCIKKKAIHQFFLIPIINQTSDLFAWVCECVSVLYLCACLYMYECRHTWETLMWMVEDKFGFWSLTFDFVWNRILFCSLLHMPG